MAVRVCGLIPKVFMTPNREVSIQYLWVQEESGLWSLPGGHVEPSDKSWDFALVRELLEELGISTGGILNVGNMFGPYRRKFGDDLHVLYLVTRYTPEPKVVSEVKDLQWISGKSDPASKFSYHVPSRSLFMAVRRSVNNQVRSLFVNKRLIQAQ